MRAVRAAAVLALSVAAFLLGIDSAAADKRVALVIGNGAYLKAPKLPNPVNDAADIAAALRKLGFDVLEGIDLNKRAMEDKIVEFGRKLDDANLALFFYAGHGMQVSGKNFLIPIDAKLERAGDLNFETLDVSLVLQQMEGDRRVNLIFLDACRTNPLARSFSRALGSRSAAIREGLASIPSAAGTMIAYATQPDNVASDGEGRNSPFTTALLKYIATPGLEVGSLMKRVRTDVVNATHEKQVPWDHSSLMGDVVLVPAVAVASAAPTYGSTLPVPALAADAAERAWAAAKDTKHQAVLEDFIRRFGDSFYVTLARAALEDLKKSQVAIAAPPVQEQLASEWKYCTGRSDIDWNMQIRNCTALIQSDRETRKNIYTAYINRALAYFSQKDFDRSISDNTEAIKFNPQSARAYDNRGEAYRAKGDTDRAIADYSEAIKLDPKFSLAYYDRGNSYRDKNVIDRAIADYSEAIRLNSQYAPAYINRGDTYRIKGDTDRAIADYNEAIKLNPKYAPVYLNRGYAYSIKRDNDRAIADYNEAIKLNPKYALAYNNRGYAYFAKNDNDRAIADYSDAIELNPQYALAYNNRGYAYSAKGDPSRAIADHSEAIRLNSKDAFAFYHRGNAYIAMGENERAIADLSEAIRLDPKGEHGCAPCAFNSRGLAYFAKGDIDRAISNYDEAIRLEPKHALFYSNRAKAYSAKGDSDRAIADYSEVISLEPRNLSAYFTRGLFHLYGGSLAKAQSDFKQASDLNPKLAYAALWLDITERRNNIPSHLPQAARKLDMNAWPAPVVRLFLGDLTVPEVFAAAEHNDPVTKNARVCEANFFIAELALLHGAKDDAIRMFKLAASDCPKNYIERDAANAELQALSKVQ